MSMPGGSNGTPGPRVLLMSRYGRLGASSRLRFQQFLPSLRQDGFRITEASLLDDQYVRELYQGRVRYSHVGLAYLRRAARLLTASKFDLVWLEKELLPWLPAALEMGLLPREIPLVVDYDDAIFHRYDEHRLALVRRLLGRKIDDVMRRAAVVTAGNGYLASRARSAGCKRVELVPTVVDMQRYRVSAPSASSTHAVIGWIGSPTTAKYLQSIAPPIRRLQSRFKLRCVAIGARSDQVANTPFEPVPWSEDGEVSALQALDIGVMPLPDEPWERGKCGYKLIQYMATELPVVASPVGVNTEIVQDGVNGYLARSEDDWEDRLEKLIVDRDLRARLGSAGRARVEETYSLQAQAPRLSAILNSTIGTRSCVA